MLDLSLLGLGAISGLAGYAASAITARAIPWFSLDRFSTVSRINDTVVVSPELAALIDKSIVCELLIPGENRLADVEDTHSNAKRGADRFADAIRVAPDLLARFYKSTANAERREILFNLLMKRGIDTVWVDAVVGDLLDPPARPPEIEPVAEVFPFPPNSEEGLFGLIFSHSHTNIGRTILDNDLTRQKVSEALMGILTAEPAAQRAFWTKVMEILHEQAKISQDIIALTDKIVQGHSRWVADVTVVNSGATPLVLFAKDAGIHVANGKGKPLVIPCRLANIDEKGKLTDVPGNRLIGPGETIKLAVISNQVEQELVFGQTLRGIVEDGTGKAWATIHGRAKGQPWNLRFKTPKEAFVG